MVSEMKCHSFQWSEPRKGGRTFTFSHELMLHDVFCMVSFCDGSISYPS